MSTKNAKRFKWRKRHSKVEAHDEFCLAMQRKGSWCATFYCIRKPWENQTWKVNFLCARELSSITEQGDLFKTLTHQATQKGMLIKLGLLRVEIWWLMEDRTGRPVVFAQHTEKFIVENDDMDSHTGAESEMSLESRSFLHRVNDQVRKEANERQRQTLCDMENVYVFYNAKHLYSWRRVTQTIYIPSKNTEDPTMKQMFDISEKLISEQSDEIYGVNTINWQEFLNGKYFIFGWWWRSHQSLAHKGVRISDSVLCLGKMNENPITYCMGRQMTWFKSSPEYRAMDRIDGQPMEIEWNISQDSPHCSLSVKSKSYCQDWA